MRRIWDDQKENERWLEDKMKRRSMKGRREDDKKDERMRMRELEE